MKNRLDVSANFAIWNMHAKYKLTRAIHLARAMGVVRNSPRHLIIGGCLNFYIRRKGFSPNSLTLTICFVFPASYLQKRLSDVIFHLRVIRLEDALIPA